MPPARSARTAKARCATCGSALRRENKFCPNCGALVATTPGPAADAPPTAPAPFTRDMPSLQIGAQSAEALEEQRKVVTVMFADLSGSTPLAERLDPEELRGILAAYFRHLSREIQRFGGTVDKYIGDAVMAVFGAPTSHDDDPERAVSAALAMLEAIATENEQLERKYGVRLSLRIGINTGEVVAGLLAGDVQGAYTVVGDAVNTAQRFESVATPNTVLVGESTYRLARRTFWFEELPPVALKGKAEPVPAFRVRHRERRAAPRDAPSLIGRGAELDRLHGILRRSLAGGGEVAHLYGDAGVGKTRLVNQFLAEAPVAVMRLRARCISYESATPFALVADLIRRAFRIQRTEDEASARDALASEVPQLGVPNDESAVALFLEVLGHGARSTLDPQKKRTLLVSLVRALLRYHSAAGGVIVIAEDVHWMDAASAELLGEVVADVPTLSCLFLTTGRDGQSCAWAATRIGLGPLGGSAADELMDRLGLTTDPAVRALVQERTGGNPFFIEEIVRAMAASGVQTVPATVQDVLEARLDRLEPQARRTAQHAAVIGRTFWIRVLQRLVDGALERAIAALEVDAVIVPLPIAAERTYAFRHALLQEAAYQMQLLSQRRRIHEAVGDAIAGTFADRLDEFTDLLAYHYGRGADDAKAARFLLRAGQRAQRLFAKDEALSYYRAAAERSADDAVTRAAAYEGIGDVQRFGAAYDDALASYAKTSETVGADDHLARSRLLRKTGAIHILRGDPAAALATLSDALARLPAEAGGERARILLEIGEIRWREGRYDDAIASLLEAVADAERALDDGARAEALKQLGTVHVVKGEKQRGLEFYERSLELYGTVADAAGQATVLNNIGIALQRLGRYADALEAYRRSLEMRERIGDPLGIAQTRNNRAEILRLRGDLDAATTDHRAALELWQAIGYASVGLARSSLGIIEVERGNADAAREHLYAAIGELERAGNRTYLLDPQRHLARAYLIDDPETALQWAERALAAARELRATEREGFALQVLGLVHEARGDRGGAIAALEAARGILDTTADRHELARTLTALARLYRALPDGDPRRGEADALERDARDIFTELGAALDLRRLDASGAGR